MSFDISSRPASFLKQPELEKQFIGVFSQAAVPVDELTEFVDKTLKSITKHERILISPELTEFVNERLKSFTKREKIQIETSLESTEFVKKRLVSLIKHESILISP